MTEMPSGAQHLTRVSDAGNTIEVLNGRWGWSSGLLQGLSNHGVEAAWLLHGLCSLGTLTVFSILGVFASSLKTSSL